MNTVYLYNWRLVRQDQDGNYITIDAENIKGIFENEGEEYNYQTEIKVNEILKHMRHIDRVIWKIENNVYREDK